MKKSTIVIRTITFYSQYTSYLVNGKVWLNAIEVLYALANAGLSKQTPAIALVGTTVSVDVVEVPEGGAVVEYRNRSIEFKQGGVKHLGVEITQPGMALMGFAAQMAAYMPQTPVERTADAVQAPETVEVAEEIEEAE